MFTSMFVFLTLAAATFGNDVVCPPTGTIYLPHPKVSDKLVSCNNGTQTAVDCPDGLHFDVKGGFCFSPNALKKNFKSDELQKHCPHHHSCSQCTPTRPPPDYTVCPDYPFYPGYGYPDGSCPPCNDRCKVHFLRDTRDCSVFYICNMGRPIWKRCPRGLMYNPTLEMCDFPCNSGCTQTNPAPCS